MAKQHPLRQLEGKTIKQIKVVDHDFYGIEESVGEKIQVTCEDGEEFTFIAEGGYGPFYATVTNFDPDEDDGVDLVDLKDHDDDDDEDEEE